MVTKYCPCLCCLVGKRNSLKEYSWRNKSLQKGQELGETEYLLLRIWGELEGFREEVTSECVLNKRDGCKDT